MPPGQRCKRSRLLTEFDLAMAMAMAMAMSAMLLRLALIALRDRYK